MKAIGHQLSAISLLCLLTGCASTRLYEQGPDGRTHLVASFQSNAQNVNYDHGPIHFHADSLDNAAATLAQGQAANNALHGVATLATSTGAAVATSGLFPAGLRKP